MPTWIVSTVKWLVVLLVVTALLVWMVLAASLFSDFRKSLVGNILTKQLGQEFLVEGDVRVLLGRTTRVHVSGASIPSTTISNVNLAELSLLEWELDLPALLDRRIDLDNLIIDGLQVNLLTQDDGTTSWETKARASEPESLQAPVIEQTVVEEEAPTEATRSEKTSILSFLKDKTVTFTNIGLLIDSKPTGFEFNFDLKSVLLEQLEDGNLVSVTSNGSVNGENFELNGDYPKGKPFTNIVNFGQIVLSYNGEAISADQGGGHAAKFDLDTGEIGEVFDVLGLQRSFEGRGNLSATVKSQADHLSIQDIDTVLQLSEGQEITVQGGVDNLMKREGFDIQMLARLHPEGQPPAKAKAIKDIKLVGIDARVVSEDQNLEFEKLVLSTNASDFGLDEVGPVSIGRIHRTPEGTIGLQDIKANVGDEAAPFLTASGDIGDALKFKSVDLIGTLAGPSSLLLKSLSEDEAAKFGRIVADFGVSDASGSLSLQNLSARSEDTDLWALDAEVSIEDVTKLDGVNIAASLNIEDSASFLAALQVEPVDVGKLELGLKLTGEDKTADIGIQFKAGKSDLDTNVSFDLSQEINVIRGTVLSERMRLEDLRDGAKAILELGKTRGKGAPSDEAAEPEDDRPPIQPLVLEDEDAEILSLTRILTETDLEIGLELKEFIGDAGVSSMSSTFVALEGMIQAGPLEFFYGDGYFKVEASMNALENPDIVKVSGSTNGWDFGRILDAIGLKIDAGGTLNANFDVTGNIKSAKVFANSLYGSAALNMGNGYIGTSLLELAGLGIFPWLFSEELAARQTEIRCVRAPIKINAGNVSFDSVVVETRSVQLVARGAVDWVQDQIQIRAEPRRAGKPLSRSAWPFDVTGKLSEPKFKLDIGGSRMKRTDGADQMPTERTPCQPDILQLK